MFFLAISSSLVAVVVAAVGSFFVFVKLPPKPVTKLVFLSSDFRSDAAYLPFYLFDLLFALFFGP